MLSIFTGKFAFQNKTSLIMIRECFLNIILQNQIISCTTIYYLFSKNYLFLHIIDRMKFICPKRNNPPKNKSQNRQQQQILSPIQLWQSSNKTLVDYQNLLQSPTHLQQLRNISYQYFEQIHDKDKFERFVTLYYNFLLTLETDNLIKKEIEEVKKKLILCHLYDSNIRFSIKYVMELKESQIFYTALNRLQCCTINVQIFRKIIISYCFDQIEKSLLEITEFLPTKQKMQMYKSIIPAEQEIKQINDISNKKINQEDIMNILFHILELLISLGDINQARLLIQIMVQTQHHQNHNLKIIQFNIQITNIFMYDLQRFLDISYQQITNMTIPQLIHQIIINSSIHKLIENTGIFDKLNPNFLMNQGFSEYAMSQLCSVQMMMNLYKYKLISKKQAECFWQKIKHDEFSKYYNMIEKIKNIAQIDDELKQTIIKTLQICRMLYLLFEINDQIALIANLLQNKIKKQNLQTLSYQLLNRILSNYCTVKFKQKTIQFNKEIFDIQVPQFILKICLYLNHQLFQKIFPENKLHQIIFRTLISYQKFNLIKELLTPKILNKYNIQYALVEIVATSQIFELYSKQQYYMQIFKDVQYLIDLLKSNNGDCEACRHLFYLSNYLHQQEYHIAPNILYKTINIDLLYKIAQKNVNFDFDKIYNHIKKIQNQDQIDLNSKEYLQFKGQLAVNLCKAGFQEQGYKILKEIDNRNMGWLCNQVIQCLQYTNNDKKLEQKFLILGYNTMLKIDNFIYLKNRWEKIIIQQQNLFRKLLDFQNKYNFIFNNEQKFILKKEEYINSVSQNKFNDPIFAQEKYQLFFTLLPNDHKQAFYYLVKQNVDLTKIEFFLKDCITKQIMDYFDMTLIFWNTTLYDQESKLKQKTKYKQFIKIQYKILLQNYLKTKKQSQKNLINKYYQINTIINICQKQFLKLIYRDTKKIIKFLEVKSYRKNQIVEQMSNVHTKPNVLILNKLAQFQVMNLIELATLTICSNINNSNSTKQIENILKNLNYLIENDQKQIINCLQRFSTKVQSLKNLIMLFKHLQTDINSCFSSYILSENIQIIECVARIDKNNVWSRLVPKQFIYTALNFGSLRQQLSVEHSEILYKYIELDNVLVISKFVFFTYGLNERLEKQVFKLLSTKYVNMKQIVDKLIN